MVREVMVTGASGFIGRALCPRLSREGCRVLAVSRRSHRFENEGVISQQVASLTGLEQSAFSNVDAVIHLAGLAHAPGLDRARREQAFAGDAETTRQLAESAARAGVKRFVFVSTAKVLGEESTSSRPFDEASAPEPHDTYAGYKLLAENHVAQVGERFGMEWVVVRPVLVYGDGVKGNLATLLDWLHAGYPLPFKGIDNRRSLIAMQDLTTLLVKCIEEDVSGQRLLAAGADPLSTPAICEALASGLGRRARLWQLPSWTWSLFRRLPVTQRKAQRIAGSFVVHNRRTRELTGWHPSTGTFEGLVSLGRWYAEHKSSDN